MKNHKYYLSITFIFVIILLFSACGPKNLHNQGQVIDANITPSMTMIHTTSSETPTPTITPLPPTQTPTKTLFPSEVISISNFSKLTKMDSIPAYVEPALAWGDGGKNIIVGTIAEVFVFNANTGQMNRSIPTGNNSSLKHVVISRNGSLLAIGGKIIDISSGKETSIYYNGFYPQFSLDSTRLSAWVSDGEQSPFKKAELTVWEMNTGKILYTFGDQYINNRPSIDIDFKYAISPDGKTLATSGRRPGLWNLETGELISPISSGKYTITKMVFSPDGKYLAGITAGSIILWNMENYKIIRYCKDDSLSYPQSLAFSDDSKYLASGGAYGDIWICETATGKNLIKVIGNNQLVTGVVFSPDGEYLATIGSNEQVDIINLQTGEIDVNFAYAKESSILGSYIADVKYTHDGNFLVEDAWPKNAINFIDVDTKELSYSIPTEYNIYDIDISHNDNYLAVAFGENGASVWDLKTRKMIKQLLEEKELYDLEFSPDNRYLVISNYKSQEIYIFYTGTWNLIKVLKPPENSFDLRSISFSPTNSRFIAVYTHHIRVWDSVQWKFLSEINISDYQTLSSASFSPNGRYFVTGVANFAWSIFSIMVYDANSWRVVQVTPVEFLQGIVFSPDSKMMILDDGSMSYDKMNVSIYAINKNKWEYINQIKDIAFPIVFSQDGKNLVAVDAWNSLVFYGVP